jgi:uracil-DNA glycosylase
MKQIKGYDKVLALGGQVSKTLNTLGVEHFSLPHPSPRNRMMNDEKNVKHIIQKCKNVYYGRQK